MSEVKAPRNSFLFNLWGFVDSSRRFFINVIFLAILIFILVMLLIPSGLKLKDKTALILSFEGRIVEQYSGSAREKLEGQLLGGGEDGQTQLRDIKAALETAAKDEKIDRIFLQLDEFKGAGLSTLREVGAAIDQFKASGKQVVAWGSNYSQTSYYLAARADEIYMHPFGFLVFEGYGRYRNYYKEAFERLGIAPNVIRVGKFKNFGEPYFATGPSKETTESDKYLYDDLWATYTSDVEKARKFAPGTINKSVDDVLANLKAVNGDFAKLALDAKLITGIKTLDEIRAMMIERGAKDEENKTFRQVGMNAYLSKVKPAASGDVVGVIVAEGDIGDGMAPPGKIGGRSTSELIRKARDDDKIKAIVLRVNSPGGSAFGSELIRRELELTRTAGKPVVISMGNVAASGGYWISMSADEIIADKATVTGSIGVFSILPTGEKAMEKLSLYTGGYHTTWLGSAMYDPRRALDPRMAELVQIAIGRVYSEFMTKAALARNTTPEKIDDVAQGRVWTGTQAKDRGLVDRVGSLDDAIASARTKAKLETTAGIRYIEADRGRFEQLIAQLGGAAVTAAATQFVANAASSALSSSGANSPMAAARSVASLTQAQQIDQDLLWLIAATAQGRSGAPFSMFAHCLCEPH